MPQLQSVKAVGFFLYFSFLFFFLSFCLKDVICKMGIIYGFGGFSFVIVCIVKKICTFSCNSRCIFKLTDLLVMYTIIVM